MGTERMLRVGFPTVINGKIGLMSPKLGTGNVNPKDWTNYKEPEWEFLPMNNSLLSVCGDGWIE